MKKAECSNCGADARILRGSYPFKESGLKNVVFQGIQVVRCRQCGNEDPIIPRINKLMRLLALSVVCKPYRLQGEEVRFLRKFLGKTGDEFSRMLHVDKTTLSKWENNGDPVGEQSDRLIRVITLGLTPELREQMDKVITAFPQIRDSRHSVHIEIDPENMSYAYA